MTGSRPRLRGAVAYPVLENSHGQKTADGVNRQDPSPLMLKSRSFQASFCRVGPISTDRGGCRLASELEPRDSLLSGIRTVITAKVSRQEEVISLL